jgi:hypothetical protein
VDCVHSAAPYCVAGRYSPVVATGGELEEARDRDSHVEAKLERMRLWGVDGI